MSNINYCKLHKSANLQLLLWKHIQSYRLSNIIQYFLQEIHQVITPDMNSNLSQRNKVYNSQHYWAKNILYNLNHTTNKCLLHHLPDLVQFLRHKQQHISQLLCYLQLTIFKGNWLNSNKHNTKQNRFSRHILDNLNHKVSIHCSLTHEYYNSILFHT